MIMCDGEPVKTQDKPMMTNEAIAIPVSFATIASFFLLASTITETNITVSLKFSLLFAGSILMLVGSSLKIALTTFRILILKKGESQTPNLKYVENHFAYLLISCGMLVSIIALLMAFRNAL
jgi:hypothetical protein